MTAGKPTLIEERVATISGRLGLAAARLAVETSQLMSAAFAARKDIDQKTLAEIVGVTEGRVSQVLRGDGNVHVATLARYLAALGYDIEISARPTDSKSPALKSPRRRGRGTPQRSSRIVYSYTAVTANSRGIGTECVEVSVPKGEKAPEFLTRLELVNESNGRLSEAHSAASDRIRERSLAATIG